MHSIRIYLSNLGHHMKTLYATGTTAVYKVIKRSVEHPSIQLGVVENEMKLYSY